MLKGLAVACLFLPLFLLVTCKELPTNPYNDVRNLKIGLFLTGNKVSALAGDSVQVGVTVNIPKLVKSLKSIDGEENLERVLTLENPNTTTPDTVYFKTLYKTPGSKTITVRVMLTDNMPTDYPFEIVVLAAPGKNDPTVWKQDTLSISATENSVISKSLDSLLADKTLAEVSFGCDKGTISQRVWSDTIRWGAPAVDTVVITANYNNNAYPLKLFIRVLASDTSLPNIVLVDPSTADAMISSNVITCKFTIIDSLSGISSVVFKSGTTLLSDTIHSGDTYQCTVKDLPAGVKTIVTVEAVDRSQKKNAAVKEISLTYNPDMQDNVRPVISLKNPLVASFSVSTAETTIQLQCTDQSGIMSVTAMKGSTALTVQKTDSVYSIAVTSLVAGKTDTIVVTAIDSSVAANSSTLPLYIKYDPSMLDTKGPVITLTSPVNNGSTPVSSVTMRVVCRDESPIATVNYKIGTITGVMTKENDSTFSSVISGLVSGKNQITISAKDASVNNNRTDSVFTVNYDPTMNDAAKPVITFLKAVRDTLLVNTASTTIEVLCTDSSGIDKVTCVMGTSAIPVTAGSGNVYSAVVAGLTIGANALVFTATDKAAKPNSDSKTIVVMYDPTATDVTGPVIKLSSPAQDRSKVAQASVKLMVVCKDDNGIGAVSYTFGTVNGAMTKDNDSTFSVALANLVQGDNQITILATDASSKKNVNDTVFTIVYDPTMNDNAAPVISLKAPEKDSAKVSSKSITIEVVCTDASGIDTVTCKMGTSDVPVVKGTGGVYSASVTTLAVGANTFMFTATDKASTKHSESKTVTVIYDPSMVDNVPPTVTIKNPQNADQRVFADTITIQIDCSDDNNISSVTATRAGVALSGITNTGSLYSVKVTGLTAGKSDTINFKVVDNSSNKVAKDFPVILRYNRNPIAATLGTPADGATGVAKSPTFTWTGGTDPDGDAVTYMLRYGTSETALTKTVPNLTAGTTTLATALNGAIKYYWQVVTYTAVNGDSAVSGVASFTTVEDAPVITAEPTTQSVDLGNKGTFTVNATGLNLKYQWYKGTTAISGATLASYMTSAVIASDDGSTYYCEVSNGGGKVKSATVSLIVKFGVTYDVNGGSGNPPSDNKTYAKGESATVQAGSGLTRTDYTFGGWGRSATGNTKVYNATDTLKIGAGSVTLYAVWNLIPTYTVTYSGNGSNVENVPSDTRKYTQGASVTVATGTPTRVGYTFAGWKAGGSVYNAGDKFTMGTDNVTLQAQWTLIPTYSVTYDGNGNTGGTVPSDTRKYAQGASVTVATGTPTRDGYTFTGWSIGGSGSPYNAGQSFTMGAGNVTLKAQWKVLGTLKVTYNPNGGGIAWGHGSGGTVPVDTKLYAANETVTVLGNTGNLTKFAYTFDGWSRSKTYSKDDAPVTSFAIGNKDDTLYARWVIMDASGNKYDEVTMPGGVWMLQNLRTAKFNDGSDIPLWNIGGNSEVAKYYPGDLTYGAYYNGYAAALDTLDMLAPPGWHIITKLEYAAFQYGTQGIAKNLASQEYWKIGSTTNNAPGQQPSLNNSSGFTAIPSGYFNGSIFQRGEQAEFWMNGFTTNEYYTSGQTWYLNWDEGMMGTHYEAAMFDYFSVRCIRDF